MPTFSNVESHNGNLRMLRWLIYRTNAYGVHGPMARFIAFWLVVAKPKITPANLDHLFFKYQCTKKKRVEL